jgi:hypothetical protein
MTRIHTPTVYGPRVDPVRRTLHPFIRTPRLGDSTELAQMACSRALDLLRQGKRAAAADAFDGLALILRGHRPTARLHPKH